MSGRCGCELKLSCSGRRAACETRRVAAGTAASTGLSGNNAFHLWTWPGFLPGNAVAQRRLSLLIQNLTSLRNFLENGKNSLDMLPRFFLKACSLDVQTPGLVPSISPRTAL